MSQPARWLIGGGFLIAVFGAFLYRDVLGPPNVVWRDDIREGNRLISEIEAFDRNHGRLPSELSEVSSSAAERKRLLYERCSETHYIVWFGTTLGESMTYDSNSRNWAEVNEACR